MTPAGRPVCAQCGAPIPGAFDAQSRCASCRNTSPAFDRACAPWRYTGAIRQAVRQWKYHRRWRIGRWLAQEMAETANHSLPIDAIDAVVPVPLHWLKRQLRGGNPPEELARDLARRLGKPLLARSLRRARWTTTQTRLRGGARFRNVRHAFTARASEVRGRTLLLVDDVLTSGATAQACALALKTAGAAGVFVLTAARTPRHRLN